MGSVVISLDAELGWGFHDRALPENILRDARENWLHLRRLFDTYEIPATWAITGHLFLDSCTECHSKHPAGERCCTCSTGDLSAENIWFGSELIDEIATASVSHELAGHSFTHVHFNQKDMTAELVSREIENCATAAARRGFDLNSFVFPVNNIRNRDVLTEHGFNCYRGINPTRPKENTLRYQARKVSSAVTGKPTPPIVNPHVDKHGLVNVPASLYLFNIGEDYRHIFTRTGEDPVVRQVKSGIDRVIGTDGVLHLWFHPHDIRNPHHYKRLLSIVQYIDCKRDTDGLRVETMGEIADRVQRETTTTTAD